MTPSKKRQRAKSCAELIEDVEENEMPDHEKADAEVTANGKYRCRYCGMLFETLEAHDKHYRKVHWHSQAYLHTVNQS
ncbi:MAG: hypothetical protein ABR909_05090 [Candidatus Bathyarchaeia archaeon]|jgi:rubrerythrin